MVGPASPTSRRRCRSTFRPARSRARRSRRECSPSLDHLVPGRCLLGQHRLQRRGGRLDVGRPRLSPQAATTDAVAVSGRFPDPAPQAAQPAAPEIVRQYADTLARLGGWSWLRCARGTGAYSVDANTSSQQHHMLAAGPSCRSCRGSGSGRSVRGASSRPVVTLTRPAERR